ncbi:MAG: glutamine amidotransferase-related protein [Halobacteriota archaeon]
MNVLVIDNYDSFVYNIVQHVGELGGTPLVYRNDELTLEEVKALEPDRIILSPGPGIPTEARFFGVCSAILKGLSPTTSTLGVCLGHQGIVAATCHFLDARRKLIFKLILQIHSYETSVWRCGIRHGCCNSTCAKRAPVLH